MKPKTTRINTEIINAQNLSCVRSGRMVFSGLSFRLNPGQMLCLRGANGSGKTSLLRIIAGLLSPISGQVAVGDAFHYVGHANAINPIMPASDMLRFWAGLIGASPIKLKKIEEILEDWHLRDIAPLPTALLSAGQKRALALCRMSLQSRPLWLLDEPNAGLDHAHCDILYQHIDDHLHRGGAVILASHSHQKISENAFSLDMDSF